MLLEYLCQEEFIYLEELLVYLIILKGLSQQRVKKLRSLHCKCLQTNDKKLMFKSVISTFRLIRKQDIVTCAFNKQNMLIFNQSFVFYPKNVLSKIKSHIKVKITVVCLQNLHFQAKLQTICKNNTYFSLDFTRAHFQKYGVDDC